MKYPGIAPAGSGPEGSGWALAGTDLLAAVERLRGSDDPIARIELAEVLRRRFAFDEALAVLRPGGDDPLLLLAEGTVRWARGDAAAARPLFRRARRISSASGDADGVLAAVLGLARCGRVNVDRRSRRFVGIAGALAAGSGDVHLRADVDRERAAWALLSGDHDTASELATRAADVHRDLPDRHLLGLAEVLRARALHGSGDPEAGIALMRAQVEESARIGSVELDLTATTFLGQFLQRGVGRDRPRWAEAEAVIQGGLARADDPFTCAELILPLAQLHTVGGEFELAAAELAEYARLYALIGGNRIATANLWKARARLDLARLGGPSPRSMRALPTWTAAAWAARRDLRRAGRAYRDAGLVPGELSVRWHLSLLDVLATGHSTEALLPAGGGDPLDRARNHLLAAEVLRGRRIPAAAGVEYAAAEADATAAGATLLAVVATTGAAEVFHELDDHPRALDALRSTVEHVERIRASVVSGAARGHVATVLREHYERALVLAARMGAGDLALELVERLRTERLSGLLHRTVTDLPPEVVEVLHELGTVDDASVRVEPGIRGSVSSLVLRDLGPLDAAALSARRIDLLARLAALTSQLFADTYGAQPLRPDLLTGLDADVLALVPVTADGADDIVVVRRSGLDGRSIVTITPVNTDLARLRDVLSARGPGAEQARTRLTSRDLGPLAHILPELPCASSGRPLKLIVVPTGWLWAVPFAALPLPAGDLLVDRADLVLTPSLRFHQVQAARLPAAPGPRAAVSFTDPDAPDIDAAEVGGLDAHPDGHTRLPDSSRVRDVFVRGGPRWRVAVVAAHGNREPGLGQAVLAGGRPVLSAADFLDGTPDPPRLLSFASCNSAYPDGDDQHEPLGLAIAALAAGADAVLSAQMEIDARSGTLTDCLRRVYADLAVTDDMSSALGAALRDPVRRGPDGTTPLYRWAALIVIGVHRQS